MFGDILDHLEVDHKEQAKTAREDNLFKEPAVFDSELQEGLPGRALDLSPSQYEQVEPDSIEMQARVSSLAARLRKEVQRTPQSSRPSSRPLTRVHSLTSVSKTSDSHTLFDPHQVGEKLLNKPTVPDIKDRLAYARYAFNDFRRILDDISVKLISSGDLLDPDHVARTNQPVIEVYQDSPDSSIGPNVALMRVKGTFSPLLLINVQLFTWLTGYCFAYDMFIGELIKLHEDVVRPVRPKKRLHFHIYEALKRKNPVATQPETSRPLSRREALAKLEGREYVRPKQNIFRRYKQLEDFLLSSQSVFAFRTMLATMIFAILLLAPSSRSFFLNYNLNGGLITIV